MNNGLLRVAKVVVIALAAAVLSSATKQQSPHDAGFVISAVAA